MSATPATTRLPNGRTYPTGVTEYPCRECGDGGHTARQLWHWTGKGLSYEKPPGWYCRDCLVDLRRVGEAIKHEVGPSLARELKRRGSRAGAMRRRPRRPSGLEIWRYVVDDAGERQRVAVAAKTENAARRNLERVLAAGPTSRTIVEGEA